MSVFEEKSEGRRIFMADHGCHPSPAPWCVQPWQWGPLERTQLLTLNFFKPKKKITSLEMPNSLPEKYGMSYTPLMIKNYITFAKNDCEKLF